MTTRRWPLLDVVMLGLGLLYVSPCLLALLNSFKTLPEIIRSPLGWPQAFTGANYAYIFTGMKLGPPMLHSLFMCVATISVLIVVASMLAYGITRLHFPGSQAIRLLFIAGLTIPFQILMLPLMKMYNAMGIGYTYLGLWLHYVSYGLPLCVFIYSGYMLSIPREVEEAAAVDGCGPFRTFWQIVFPLLRPCTAAIIIFWGLFIWNDFAQAYVLLGPSKGQLAFVQLYQFLQDKYVKNWDVIFAGVVLLSLPVTVLYLTMHRRFTAGLTAGVGK